MGDGSSGPARDESSVDEVRDRLAELLPDDALQGLKPEEITGPGGLMSQLAGRVHLGPVRVRTPRDRTGTFEPQLVQKRQTRLARLDDRVIDLYAGGMSVRDIAAHLQGLYGVEVGRDTISRVTDAVLEDVAAWRSRPLERVYRSSLYSQSPSSARYSRR